MANVFRLSCAAYGCLLALYPADVRKRYGAEMIDGFAEQLRDEWKYRGALGGLRVWLTAACAILSIAAPHQLRNPVVIATAFSLVSSSALFLAFFRAVSR
jgi:hypothetical protein